MIMPNGAPPGPRAELVLERRVVEQPGQAVGLGADLDRPIDLGVLERDRDLGGEQLDQVELLGREGVAEAEALHRQDPDRARPAAQRNDDEAAVHRPSSTSVPRKWFDRASWRSSST
jgi:hypothetical protein